MPRKERIAGVWYIKIAMRLIKFIFSITVIAALAAAIIFLCFYIHSLLPVAAAVALAYTLSVIAAVCLLTGESPADFKCAWLTVIVALPVAGAALYFLSYFSRTHKRSAQPAMPVTGCDGYEYFSDGSTYLKRLETLISSAKKSVYLEYYIISKGHIWGAIYRQLLNARARGVEVKIIYDGLGSALRAPIKDFKRLKRAGAQIKVFNKLLPLPVSRLNFRDHRKIAAIDGDAVFLGGVNIADEYANLCSPHGYWKDGGGLFFGEIAAVYSAVFLKAFDGKERDYPHTMREVTAKLRVLPVADEPVLLGSVCEDYLAAAIYSAKRRVYIFTPYLCMGDKLGDALEFAARQGVDVKIIIPHIPDKKLTYAITLTYCARLVERGAKIYTYTPGFMHFKGVMCDDGVLLGSYNFDFRSMRLNYECGIWGGGALAEDAVRDFEACLAVSEKLKQKKKCAIIRILSRLLYLFAPLV